MRIRAARWGDNDRYFGPFTFAFGDYYRAFAICLRSTDDEDRVPTFRISIGKFSFLSVVPRWLVRPEKKKVYPQWDEATVKRLGRDWYWDITPREYSVSVCDGHLDVCYGRVTHDSRTEQRWGYFLPWTQWRHVRHSFYGLDGEHVATIHDTGKSYRDDPGRFDRERAIADATPTVHFAFKDFDGEELSARTRIEEREWRFGTGWFKCLALFRRPRIRRDLDIWFSGETGKRKGSWKGGTIGHSIAMLPGELHEAAFRRYCDDHNMTFVGPTP